MGCEIFIVLLTIQLPTANRHAISERSHAPRFGIQVTLAMRCFISVETRAL